jgi:hypothetical protein
LCDTIHEVLFINLEGAPMAEKRITVWVQAFKDRTTLVLQWLDPLTGKRRSQSAGTADAGIAENARVDLGACPRISRGSLNAPS